MVDGAVWVPGNFFYHTIFDIYLIENQEERRMMLQNKLLYPSIIIGPALIIFAMFFQLKLGDIYGHGTHLFSLPDFLISRSFSWLLYTMGILLILISVLLAIEEFELIQTEKSYRFLYYFYLPTMDFVITIRPFFSHNNTLYYKIYKIV